MVSPRARIVSSPRRDETQRGKQKLYSVMVGYRRTAMSPAREKKNSQKRKTGV
jgi:hypothetical protein